MSLPSSTGFYPSMVGDLGDIVSKAGLSCRHFGFGSFRQIEFTFTAMSISVTRDGTTSAYGSQRIYNHGVGSIFHLGSVANLASTAVSPMTATAALVWGLGTVATVAGATIASTEGDLIASTAGTLVGGAGTFRNTAVVAPASFSGHTTAVPVYLNVAATNAGDAALTADASVLVTGSLTHSFVHLGDN